MSEREGMTERGGDAGHHPQIGGVFEDRERAEAAVEDLRRLDLADEHLGVAVHEGQTLAFEKDVETEVAHGMQRGITLGAPIGALAGMTVLAVVVPGVGMLGLGGILATGAATGALAGGFWGAYLGLSASTHVLEEEWDWERLALEPGHVVVVVDQHGHPDDVTEVLRRHGARIVSRPKHIV
jgi:hypothetical protein